MHYLSVTTPHALGIIGSCALWPSGGIKTPSGPIIPMIPRAWGVVISQYLLSVTNETLIRAHGIVYFNTKTGNYYRVTNLLVGLTWILTVPLSARFCLGWWEFGRRGWAAGQDGGTSQIKVNATQVRQEMGHPVHARPIISSPPWKLRFKRLYP